ncbi:hypothetical protein Thiowin_01602 [Thiorhodovibrio winogradskyi]|uniref:Tox-PAAR-like domain-containing protein n=1 Tax=Thiorhodovibrio winogradskyi TaxID=77007 RepID=A0ABZ0S7Z3_9GAMM|nr:DUF4150 domain-containing protein [Thiorhodovibrio winogradskyi]
MFALSMGSGMDLGFPDVCLTPTPLGPLPIPYPDIAFSAASAPAAYNVLTSCTPSLNQLSMGLVSVGDQPGVMLGLVSHIEAGQTDYELGSLTIFADGTPMQRLTSITGQNAMGMLPNAPGVCIVPSQITVLNLG